MSRTDYMIKAFRDIGISLSDKQVDQFNKYYSLLIEQNKVMNLTAITDYEEVVIKHFIDSLCLIRVTDLSEEKKIIDVGTGAGFPGIPLKIVYPNLRLVLLDSLNKRIKFLEDVISELGLNRNSITTIHGRAEDFGQDELYREKFDLCVSRAVANLSTLSEYCIPFVKLEGSFIPYKAGDIQDEVKEARKAVNTLGGNIKIVDSFRLPGTDIDRSLIKIDKINKTPKKYPRQAGKPKNQPLK